MALSWNVKAEPTKGRSRGEWTALSAPSTAGANQVSVWKRAIRLFSRGWAEQGHYHPMDDFHASVFVCAFFHLALRPHIGESCRGGRLWMVPNQTFFHFFAWSDWARKQELGPKLGSKWKIVNCKCRSTFIVVVERESVAFAVLDELLGRVTCYWGCPYW